jgi:hypothetical protein
MDGVINRSLCTLSDKQRLSCFESQLKVYGDYGGISKTMPIRGIIYWNNDSHLKGSQLYSYNAMFRYIARSHVVTFIMSHT